jgi:hypothetical protein
VCFADSLHSRFSHIIMQSGPKVPIMILKIAEDLNLFVHAVCVHVRMGETGKGSPSLLNFFIR